MSGLTDANLGHPPRKASFDHPGSILVRLFQTSTRWWRLKDILCCGGEQDNFFFPRQQPRGPSNSRRRRTKTSPKYRLFVTTVFNHSQKNNHWNHWYKRRVRKQTRGRRDGRFNLIWTHRKHGAFLWKTRLWASRRSPESGSNRRLRPTFGPVWSSYLSPSVGSSPAEKVKLPPLVHPRQRRRGGPGAEGRGLEVEFPAFWWNVAAARAQSLCGGARGRATSARGCTCTRGEDRLWQTRWTTLPQGSVSQFQHTSTYKVHNWRFCWKPTSQNCRKRLKTHLFLKQQICLIFRFDLIIRR